MFAFVDNCQRRRTLSLGALCQGTSLRPQLPAQRRLNARPTKRPRLAKPTPARVALARTLRCTSSSGPSVSASSEHSWWLGENEPSATRLQEPRWVASPPVPSTGRVRSRAPRGLTMPTRGRRTARPPSASSLGWPSRRARRACGAGRRGGSGSGCGGWGRRLASGVGLSPGAMH